jgi:hypothetical protein
MRQFEQDWLELGRRVACSLHYQHPRNLRLLQVAKAELAVGDGVNDQGDAQQPGAVARSTSASEGDEPGAG